MPKVKTPRGAVRKAILDAIAKHTRPVSMDDIIDRVKAAVPTMDKHKLSVALSNTASTGAIVRTSAGFYTLPTAASNFQAANVPAAAVIDYSAEELDDIAVMEELLAALAKAERVVRKNRQLVDRFAALRSAMGGIK